MPDRAFAIFYARVMLRECSLRRDRVNRDFWWTLFNAAQRARRRAADMGEPQGDLFGAAA